MTDSQLRFRTLMEDQRHNLVLEKYQAQQTAAQKEQAAAATRNAETNVYNAITARKNYDLAENSHWWDVGFKFASFVIPDANTALKAGASVVSSLFS